MRTTLNRFFGKCRVKGCAYRRVTNDTHINGESIFYRGSNRAALREIGAWCPEHNRPLDWTQLQGRVSPDKECNDICMAAVGPSCDCSCGGENHGKNHVHI